MPPRLQERQALLTQPPQHIAIKPRPRRGQRLIRRTPRRQPADKTAKRRGHRSHLRCLQAPQGRRRPHRKILGQHRQVDQPLAGIIQKLQPHMPRRQQTRAECSSSAPAAMPNPSAPARPADHPRAWPNAAPDRTAERRLHLLALTQIGAPSGPLQRTSERLFCLRGTSP